MARGLINETWKSTSYSVSPLLRRGIDLYLTSKNLTMSKMMNALFYALIAGDIQIDEVPYGEIRMSAGNFTTLEDLININFRDKEGNLLNTTRNLNLGGR